MENKIYFASVTFTEPIAIYPVLGITQHGISYVSGTNLFQAEQRVWNYWKEKLQGQNSRTVAVKSVAVSLALQQDIKRYMKNSVIGMEGEGGY